MSRPRIFGRLGLKRGFRGSGRSRDEFIDPSRTSGGNGRRRKRRPGFIPETEKRRLDDLKERGLGLVYRQGKKWTVGSGGWI